MWNTPKTLEKAREYRYNRWAGNPRGRCYSEGHCAYEISHHIPSYQCSRKHGHGPSNLYCKQHAKKVNEEVKNAL